MNEDTGQFRIVSDSSLPGRAVRQDRILIGRLETCDVVLDDPTVSRIHAGITFNDSQYILANLSTSNVLTLNGRVLGPKESDVLTDGDTIQIGPFAILVAEMDEAISVTIQKEYSHSEPPVSGDNIVAPDG